MEKLDFLELKKELPGIEENVSLKNQTTFKIGGPARFFYLAKTKEDLIKALKTAKKFSLPFFILGGGSNLLVSDKGYSGMAIMLRISKIEIRNSGITAEAGAKLSDLVNFSLEESLTGLEWAAGIPGTVGGAIRGNAGAFGSSMSEAVKEIEIFDLQDLAIKKIKNRDCKFSYKESVFKQEPDLIILSAEIQLKKGDKDESRKRVNEILSLRKQKHPLEFPSAGCIFKNQKGEIKDRELLKEFPVLKEFNEKGIIPTGFLIDKCGLRGKRMSQAQISEKHANFIINLGKAKAEDVVDLIELTKRTVKEKFGLDLEEEIQSLGLMPNETRRH